MAGGGDFLTIFGSILEARPNGLGLLWYTREVFRNFVLKVDWLSFNPTTNVPGGRADNSGILLRFPSLNASDPGNRLEAGIRQRLRDSNRRHGL